MHCGNFSLAPRLLGGALLAASACANGAELTSPITSMLDSMELGALYRADVMSNVSGGIKRDASALGNLDLTAEIDLARLAGWTGVTAGLHGIWSHGGKPNTYLVGSMQGVDNIEVETNTAKIFQAWIEKQWQDDSFSARLGLYDLNSEFYSTRTSGIFMHPAPGIGSEMAQAGANGPSVFPTSSLALRLRYRPTSETYIQAAVLDGVPGDPDNPRGTHIQFNDGDGTLRVAEIGFTPQLAAADGAIHLSTTAKYALGVWGFSSRFADLAAVDGDGTPLPVTVTVGLARVHLHETLESAIARADAALYDGKQAGRDRWVLAEADLAAAGGTDERKTF